MPFIGKHFYIDSLKTAQDILNLLPGDVIKNHHCQWTLKETPKFINYYGGFQNHSLFQVMTLWEPLSEDLKKYPSKEVRLNLSGLGNPFPDTHSST